MKRFGIIEEIDRDKESKGERSDMKKFKTSTAPGLVDVEFRLAKAMAFFRVPEESLP